MVITEPDVLLFLQNISKNNSVWEGLPEKFREIALSQIKIEPGYYEKEGIFWYKKNTILKWDKHMSE